MKSRAFRIPVFLAVLAFSTSQLFARCGVERWSVKTGTDADVTSVDTVHPKNGKIAELIALPAPHPIPTNTRVTPTETTVFVVNATLTDYKLESGSSGDSDYHLVLEDDAGNTMVAEIPSPTCVDGASPFSAQIAAARANFDSHLTASSSVQTANIPVQITGVAMFDFAHGQRGAAPNVIEIHPVLDIVFNPSSGGGGADFSISILNSTLNLAQGGSSSVTVSTSSTANPAPNVSISASGLPPGVTAHVTPLGSGKATVQLQASTVAPTGSFPFTVTGTANGKSHSQTATLNISATQAAGGQQWEYQIVTATSDQDMSDKANQLGAQDWEMVGIVRQGTNGWKAFFKRAKRDF
jgi:hypothetical protein